MKVFAVVFFILIFTGAVPGLAADSYQVNFSPGESYGDKEKELGCQVAADLGAGRLTFNQMTPEQRLWLNYLKTNWPAEYSRCYESERYSQPRKRKSSSYSRNLPYSASVIQILGGKSVMLSTGERLELIGIKPAAGPAGVGAAKTLAEIVLNKKVSIRYDVEKKDRFGRLLGYLFLEDGTFVNRAMIEKGAAEPDIISPNGMYRARLLGEKETYPEDEEEVYFRQMREQQGRIMVGAWSLFVLGFTALAAVNLWKWAASNRKKGQPPF